MGNFNDIIFHRNEVRNNILKSFDSEFDDELEKGKWNVGDQKFYHGTMHYVAELKPDGSPRWRRVKKTSGDGGDSGQSVQKPSTSNDDKTKQTPTSSAPKKEDKKNKSSDSSKQTSSTTSNTSKPAKKTSSKQKDDGVDSSKKGNKSPIGVTSNSDELTNEDFFNILKYLKNECGINTSDVAKSPYGHEMKMYIDNEEFSVTKRAVLTQNINNGYYQVVLKNRTVGEVNLQALYIENMSDVKLSFKTNDGNVQNVNLIDIINNDKSKIKNIDEEVRSKNKKEEEDIEKIDVKKLSKPKAIKIAQNPNTPENILIKLLDSKHLDTDVKIAVTRNNGKGMTENVINKLLNSNEDLVRFRAIENLGPSVMKLDKLREVYKKEKNNDLKEFIYKIGRKKWENWVYKNFDYPGFYMMGEDWVK